ncbi:MAG TPA: hypothetical protein VJH20_05655 [Candidatus Nanoarchaeia archaeon]|nr:hypothetical protein [Candidatus Nanoarchaeia archaeon]
MVKINSKDIEYIIDAHTNFATKPSKAIRKWDGQTPYYMHPIWCATTLATETTLDEKTREEGIQVLLYHDVLEDTTKELPEHLTSRVKELINHMSFSGGSAQEMEEIWTKPIEVKLYKIYDKVSNLLDGTWMDSEKRAKYEDYTKKLCEEVIKEYKKLNILSIAREVINK